ncbi:hypothetical protein OEZ85_005546 [Tetradesmus obliquus]|uniref:SGNH hydrolase-type esterase domain-containing protein n=1 Tax=Tetradesmus obliquus TaxID=3088 RepID=A0ABY8UJ13_TETOB|nr:hypothetical protein OEZ85_005546 [Tetradesmus obliquus]
MAQGYIAVEGPRNWATLAHKLATPGTTIKIVTFGGSVTQGLHTEFPETWAHEVQRWMQRAFPAVNFELINLARDATDVTPAATCWYQLAPVDADLVLIDYSLGGCGFLQCTGVANELIGQYELFLRRLISRAPGAALMLLENFYFFQMGIGTPTNPTLPLPYYQTGGDMHAALARRYRLPMVSVRDVFYDYMYNQTAMQAELGFTKAQIMADDQHPNAKGHFILGQGILAFGIRRALSSELTALAAGGRVSGPTPLPARPVSPKAFEQQDINGAPAGTFCAEGIDFKDLATPASVKAGGWEWRDSSVVAKECSAKRQRFGRRVNCDKFGYSTFGVGKTLEFTLDTENIPKASSYMTRRQLMLFFDRNAAKGFRVTRSVQCTVRLTIMDKGPDGNNYFKVNGVAVIPLTSSNKLTGIDYLAIDRDNSFFSKHEDSWRSSVGPKAAAQELSQAVGGIEVPADADMAAAESYTAVDESAMD